MTGCPQLEDGHTRIANELLEALIRAGLTGCEMQIVLAVARLTYGYQKKADAISYNQVASLTKISRRNVIRTIQTLVRRRVLDSVVTDTRKANILSINKHYNTWVVSPTTLEPSVSHDTTLVSPTTLEPSVTGDTLQRRIKKRKKNPPLPPDGGSALSCFPNPEQKKPAAPAKKPSAAVIEKQARDVLAHLNQVCGTKYRGVGNIPARLREGHTVQDLKAIIDCKARDEFYRDNPKYLNPVTLFRPDHFERNLQEARGEIKRPGEIVDPVAAQRRERARREAEAQEAERQAKGRTPPPAFFRRTCCGEGEAGQGGGAEPVPENLAAERERQLAELQQRFGGGTQ